MKFKFSTERAARWILTLLLYIKQPVEGFPRSFVHTDTVDKRGEVNIWVKRESIVYNLFKWVTGNGLCLHHVIHKNRMSPLFVMFEMDSILKRLMFS